MTVFTKLNRLVSTFIIERKRDQAKVVATTYLEVVGDTVPVMLNAYRDMAHMAIDKTFERPDVLLNFVRAAEAMVDHYGPTVAPLQALEGKAAEVISDKLRVLGAQLETLVDASK